MPFPFLSILHTFNFPFPFPLELGCIMLQVSLRLTAVVKQAPPGFSLKLSEWCLVTDVKRTALILSKDKYCQPLLE